MMNSSNKKCVKFLTRLTFASALAFSIDIHRSFLVSAFSTHCTYNEPVWKKNVVLASKRYLSVPIVSQIRHANFRPLFVHKLRKLDSSENGIEPIESTKTDDFGVDKAEVVKIEKMLAKEARKREKMMNELQKAERRVSVLEEKKNAYLYGTPAMDDMVTSFKESTTRSLVKSIMWRMVAGTVTFITSLRFSGSVKVALSIVGSDFFSKALTMFLGERLMNNSSLGRGSSGDNKKRSLIKALIWRLFAIANTLTVAVFVAKDLSIASKIASSDAVIKTTMMYFYERIWSKVEWGKEYEAEFFI
uniref:DUF2061 domain-containing protein n=1 Tax=Corethron hystrix TaxID=216773 RepID=A0A7S1B4Q8_9STRA|mmetsp:Transcript_11108/g.24531  ORF Transcript_11108/g.24531 Transcript_11108/m.24531 type:complete len:303 (+) Transcript_11108:61-969(+)